MKVMVRVTQTLMRFRVKYRISGSSLLRAVSCQGKEDHSIRRRDGGVEIDQGFAYL